MLAPKNYIWGAGPKKINYHTRIGENAPKGDSLRYWVHWLHTKDKRSLEMPTIYHQSRIKKGLTTSDMTRRQSEWDDHGEEYPMTKEGPNLYSSIRVPAGLFYLSLYNTNKDGHSPNERFRDYLVSIRQRPDNLPLNNIEGFNTWPKLAACRMRDFWGGVYHRFLVRGPIDLTVEIHRNNSFNTILAGVFLDEVEERPFPYFGYFPGSVRSQTPQVLMSSGDADLPIVSAISERAVNPLPLNKDLGLFWAKFHRIRQENPVITSGKDAEIYTAFARFCQEEIRRTGQNSPAIDSWLGTCWYNLKFFEKWEKSQRRQGLMPARDLEKLLQWDGISDVSGRGFETIISARSRKSLSESRGKF
jgi:hypothetical protein